MKEVWRFIEGYKYAYQISSLGRVRNWMTGNILAPYSLHGYFYVKVKKDGVKKQFRVHKLVASAFLPNPDNKPCVLHRNNIKTDNRVNNLKWGLANERKCTYPGKHRRKPVLHLYTGLFFDSMRDAVNQLNLNYSVENHKIRGRCYKSSPANFQYI